MIADQTTLRSATESGKLRDRECQTCGKGENVMLISINIGDVSGRSVAARRSVAWTPNVHDSRRNTSASSRPRSPTNRCERPRWS